MKNMPKVMQNASLSNGLYLLSALNKVLTAKELAIQSYLVSYVNALLSCQGEENQMLTLTVIVEK